MKVRSCLICLLAIGIACEPAKQAPFPALTYSEDEWVAYEGKWLAHDGIIRFELFLKNGTLGVDSYYKLHESFESDSLGAGTISEGMYSTFKGFKNKEVGIRLNDLSDYDKGSYLRYDPSDDGKAPDQMFFMTRGNDELLPSDHKFNPITLDKRYTLRKRSNLFTVEGYFTFEQDSAVFFERNTMEDWKLADFGEFAVLKSIYEQKAKQKFEGIYLKALAYSVLDTTVHVGEKALVIKRIAHVGDEADTDPE